MSLDPVEPADDVPYLHRMITTLKPDGLYTSKYYMAVIERYLDKSDDHELNVQDSRGLGALHVAVQHCDVEAVAGLLMCGADINVADQAGKSPFTYCLANYDVRIIKWNHMFYTLLGHVYKLIIIGLHVSDENRQCYTKARARHVFNDKQLQLSYSVELDKMEDVRVGSDTSLKDVLYEGADEIATSMLKRRTLEEILTASDFYYEFPKLCCLLKLQYRRGLTRRKLMHSVKEALEALTGLGLPDPCTEAIIRRLNDDDLMNLLKAC